MFVLPHFLYIFNVFIYTYSLYILTLQLTEYSFIHVCTYVCVRMYVHKCKKWKQCIFPLQKVHQFSCFDTKNEQIFVWETITRESKKMSDFLRNSHSLYEWMNPVYEWKWFQNGMNDNFCANSLLTFIWIKYEKFIKWSTQLVWI